MSHLQNIKISRA